MTCNNFNHGKYFRFRASRLLVIGYGSAFSGVRGISMKHRVMARLGIGAGSRELADG
jgi:hypothetical protein